MSLVKDTINKVKRQAAGVFCNPYNRQQIKIYTKKIFQISKRQTNLMEK